MYENTSIACKAISSLPFFIVSFRSLESPSSRSYLRMTKLTMEKICRRTRNAKISSPKGISSLSDFVFFLMQGKNNRFGLMRVPLSDEEIIT